jgi:hypothetical protein
MLKFEPALCVALLSSATVLAIAGGSDIDLRLELENGTITSVRINLNPSGAQLGFDAEIDESEPDLQKLVDLVLAAEPCRGCKCPNVGAVRFTLEGGTVVGIGLLPSHDEGFFKLRFYIEDRFLGVYRVDHAALGTVLESFGVPLDDPAFFE